MSDQNFRPRRILCLTSSLQRTSFPGLRHPRLLNIGLVLALLLMIAVPVHAVDRIFNITTTLVGEVWITLTPSRRSHRIELRNFGPQGDAVLYLLTASNVPVGAAAATNGQLSLSASGRLGGQFLVVVRSLSATALQSGDVWVDGQFISSGVQFTSGALLPMARLETGEQLDGVRPPLGAIDHVVYLLTSDGLRMLRRNVGPFTRISPTSTQDILAVYATNVPQNAGALRVYRNDVNHDSDHDGLGDDLEAQLGTCATNTGYVAGANCDEIADPRDTDGDGLQDGWEVLGKEYIDQNGNEQYLALPAWGANPRHKDIFIEVDYRRMNIIENQQGYVAHMLPEAAREMAAAYGDTATTDFWVKAIHSLSVQNPDRLPGISLHLDTGVAPEKPEDATIYGDWGGFNAVDATPDGPADVGAVWKDQLGPGRMGIFHYVLGYEGGGGSCGQGIICAFNMDSAGNAAHEFGHTLALNHNGPNFVTDEPNCKPNYPSLMNYAYLDSGYMQFSDGRNFPNFNNHSLQESMAVDPSNQQPLLNALSSYFGYKVDFATGSVDWNRDGQFSPDNVRVRAYANYDPGDDCEFTREGQQDSGLQSQLSPAVVRYKDLIWIFTIDLNGKLTYSSTTQPWVCSPDADLCPTPAFQPPASQDLGPIAAIDAKTFRSNGVESVVLVAIRPDASMVYTTFSVDDSNNQTWGPVLPIPGSSPAAGEPSLANSRNEQALVLAYKGTANNVRLRSLTAGGWTAEQPIMVGASPVTVHPDTSPAVAFTFLPIGIVVGQEHLVGAFIDPQGSMQFYAPQSFPLHGWGRLPIPYDSIYSTVGRPVMAWAPGPGDGEILTLGSSGTASARAARTAARPVSPLRGHGPGIAPPVVAAPPPPAQPITTGRLYILFFEYNAPPAGYPATNPVRMAMSYVSKDDGKLHIGLNSYFDDVWSYAYGISLLTPSDVGLRAAETYSIHKPESENHVFFRPHADGMADLTYKNYDDWKTLGWATCAIVAYYQTDSPVKCADPW